MKLLLVVKKTNLERHGEDLFDVHRRSDKMLKQIEKVQLAHNQHHEALLALRKALNAAAINFDEVTRDKMVYVNLSEYQLVLTLGGDGTLLSTSHFINLENLPVVGIRSAESSVGFLCAAHYNQLEKLVSSIKNNTFVAKPILRIKAEIFSALDASHIETAPVLNEFLFSHLNPAATTRYQLIIDEETEEQKSSGLWISAPAGSSAAILAAGGTQQDLDSKQAQYLVREPFILPQALHLTRGFLNLAKQDFHLRNLCDQAILAVDGQHGTHPLRFGDTVSFKNAKSLSLVRSL